MLLAASCAGAPAPRASDPETAAARIEKRKAGWSGFTARLEMDFAAGPARGRCLAELAYERLEEKLLLKGTDASGRLLFVFRTTDRDFELYLPSQKLLVRGPVLALQDSPEIESHLRALDLYRALKPQSVPGKNVVAEAAGRRVRLRVFSNRILARKLWVNPEGDVPAEIYYDRAGKAQVSIERSGFRKWRERPEIYFPEKVTVKDRRGRKTVLTFLAIDFEEPAASRFRMPDTGDARLQTLG